MKIIENSSFINLDAYTKNIEKKVRSNDTSENINTRAEKKDEVVLSSVATKVNESKRAIDSIPDVRETKIAELKSQIAEGTYKIDSELIASKILEESLLNDIL